MVPKPQKNIIILTTMKTSNLTLIRYSAFVRSFRKKMGETKDQLFIHFKKACDSVRREVLCNILTKSGIPIRLFQLIKMCLNETYSNV
jgi:hypothetical protein